MKTKSALDSTVLVLTFWLAIIALLPPLQAAESEKKSGSDAATENKPSTARKKPKPSETATTTLNEKGWEKLFDGKTLYGWKPTDFVGQNEVLVEDGKIVMRVGEDLTGINYTNEVLRMNYEIYLEAMRVDGSDFFCGLTFPVGQDPCTLIVGGWGGGLVGFSSIDGGDAANNETTRYKSFETGKWYRIRLRVTPGHLEAWIEDEKLEDVDISGRNLSVRIEVERSKPFGIATWRTTSAIRDIRWRKLDAPADSTAKKSETPEKK
jgi:hypothetical protein